MPETVRIGTFNCENLFARFRFRRNVKPAAATRNGFTVNDLAFEFLKKEEKALTAKAIQALNADILALQEVENFDVLKRFRSTFLKPMKYTYGALIDGNDPRFIDVAVLSRHQLVRVRTHQELVADGEPIFSRDCLEVDVQVGSRTLTLFVNHLKSMLDQRDPANGRRNTRERRLLQAMTVRQLVEDRFGTSPGDQPFVVCGDLNDYLGAGDGTTDGVSELVTWDQVENVVDRLPADDRWTHFHETKKSPETRSEAYRQLDYLLLSRSLASATSAKPVVIRGGLCRNAARYAGTRLPGVGASRPAASDHCPVGVDLEL